MLLQYNSCPIHKVKGLITDFTGGSIAETKMTACTFQHFMAAEFII